VVSIVDLNPDPEPHQRDKLDPDRTYKLDPDPDPHKLADDKPYFMENEPI
jgi:hypothetical protein